MGGGGAQLAAVEDSTIKAIIALCPWIDPLQITVNSLNHDIPPLFFSGQNDVVAPPSTHANVHYNYIPSTTDKLIYEISSGGHWVANGPSGGQGEVGRMALSWLKEYLIEDYCYCPLLLDILLTASGYQTNITCPTYGCTDSIALNYDPLATIDDGSCIYPSNCTYPSPTGAYVTELIHDRVRVNWDTTEAYSFTRIKLRVDTTGGAWTSAGGFGVFYPALNKDKNGLTPGTSYRAQARTWCDLSGGPYRSLAWTSLIYWTQPTSVRIEGGTAIANLSIYPNPSRDIFNITFTSKEIQNLKVKILNVIGEELINENLEQFIGEYTKQINLSDNAMGIYFLEIETNDGVINKKLILR